MTDASTDALAAFAESLADAARPIAQRYFRSGICVDDKEDASPVTIADRTIETKMREMIADAYPNHGVLGEEHGADRTDAPLVWVLDPIDGTRSFISGKPTFGVLIALLRDGVPEIGVIDIPALDERWVGAPDRSSTHNGAPIGTRACDHIGKATFYATSPHMFKDADEAAYRRILDAVKMPLYGADCYHYGLLSSGFVDLVVEAGLKPYDYCALAPVLRRAGGHISDWSGAPLGLESDGRVLAAGSREVYEAALGLLAQG